MKKILLFWRRGLTLSDALPYIITETANCEKFGVPSSVAFDKWFDIVDPLQSNVISKFSLETTALGDTLLKSNNA